MGRSKRGGGWKRRAAELKLQTSALYLAYRDPRTPWYAKAWAGLVLAYAFSPIDLIPDFIPILGYLDDLLLVPLGIVLALRLIPAEVMETARVKAKKGLGADRPVGRAMGIVIVLVWIGLLALVIFLVYGWLRRPQIRADH